MRALITGTVLAVLLTACGDGSEAEDEPTAAEETSPTATESPTESETADPVYVETDTCRTDMAPIVDIMLANNQGSLSLGEFRNRFEQLDRRIDSALAACSPKVNNPARRVMYHFALANAQWQVCGRGDDECIAEITDNITTGVRLAQRVQTALDDQA